MSDKTKIEWADATVNYVNGCSVTSPGCTNCYAMRLAGTRMRSHPTRAGLTQDTKAGPVWTGEVRENPAALEQVLRWKKPRAIFWNAHGDLFHENVPDEWIDRQFAVMALTPQHRHMVLTKRSARMREYLREPLRAGIVQTVVDNMECEDDCPFGDTHAPWVIDPWPLPNVWLGVSVEDQARADERIPDLLATPAAIRFISAEPLLGPVDLRQWVHDYGCSNCGYGGSVKLYCDNCDWFGGPSTAAENDPCPDCGDLLGDNYCCPECGELDTETPGPTISGHRLGLIDWVIVGGESGPGARPMHPDWARSLRDQCAEAGVAFHFKQWGDWAPVKYIDGWADDFDFCFQDGSDRTLGQVNRRAECREVEGQEYARVGKARAGRLLDGVEHNGLP